MEAQTSIARHYGDGTDVERRVEEELRASGFVSGKELSPRDVAELDQFHVGGPEATEELARLLAPSPGTHVLDIGSGLGGPARYLAAEFGCCVSGIDLTAAYCRLASLLSDRMDLKGAVEFRKEEPHTFRFWTISFDASGSRPTSGKLRATRRFTKKLRGAFSRAGGLSCST